MLNHFWMGSGGLFIFPPVAIGDIVIGGGIGLLLALLMITILIVLVFLINKALKTKSLECSFELSVSFTKGFSLKFSTTNKKDAPSNK